MRKEIAAINAVPSERSEIEAGFLKSTVFDEPNGELDQGGAVWRAFHSEDVFYNLVEFDILDFPQLHKVPSLFVYSQTFFPISFIIFSQNPVLRNEIGLTPTLILNKATRDVRKGRSPRSLES
tara:strand:+ start:225 stop:593 length:369 start_codon:yes stop_codon:yes gene_type:complete